MNNHSFFEKWLLPDLVILVKGQEPRRAHQDVVCYQSEFFARLRKQDWKADNVSYLPHHPKKPRIVLKGNPRVLQVMVDFMYGFTFDSEIEQKPGGTGTPLMLFAARVYLAAKEYGIATLKDAVTLRFAMLANRDWDIPEFPSIIEEVYANTTKADKALRGPLLKSCYEHSRNYEKNEDFRRVHDKCEEFHTDLDSYSDNRVRSEDIAYVAIFCHRCQISTFTIECPVHGWHEEDTYQCGRCGMDIVDKVSRVLGTETENIEHIGVCNVPQCDNIHVVHN